MKIVCGFEIDVEAAEKLTDRARAILYHLERDGAAYVQLDGGSEDYDTRQQLKAIAELEYFSIYETEFSICLVNTDRFEKC